MEILEILKNPQTVENKGESDHCLEILLKLEIRDSKRPQWLLSPVLIGDP